MTEQPHRTTDLMVAAGSTLAIQHGLMRDGTRAVAVVGAGLIVAAAVWRYVRSQRDRDSGR